MTGTDAPANPALDLAPEPPLPPLPAPSRPFPPLPSRPALHRPRPRSLPFHTPRFSCSPSPGRKGGEPVLREPENTRPRLPHLPTPSTPSSTCCVESTEGSGLFCRRVCVCGVQATLLESGAALTAAPRRPRRRSFLRWSGCRGAVCSGWRRSRRGAAGRSELDVRRPAPACSPRRLNSEAPGYAQRQLAATLRQGIGRQVGRHTDEWRSGGGRRVVWSVLWRRRVPHWTWAKGNFCLSPVRWAGGRAVAAVVARVVVDGLGGLCAGGGWCRAARSRVRVAWGDLTCGDMFIKESLGSSARVRRVLSREVLPAERSAGAVRRKP